MNTFAELPHKEIKLDALPYSYRVGLRFPKQCKNLVELGEVKRGGNEPYCYTEEKKCAGHICRVLGNIDTKLDEATVVREDGTVWHITLDAFMEAYRIDVK